MFWKLLPHASMCIVADRIVVLDVRADRYFMIPTAHVGLIQVWLTNTVPEAPPSVLLDLLRAGGVYIDGDPDPHARDPMTIAIPAALPKVELNREVTWRSVAAVAGSVLSTALALKRWPLGAVLGDPEPEQRLSEADRETQRALASIFDIARRFVPVERRCLVDSLALTRWLRQHGHSARLVFGVTGVPFAAHCWVQNDVCLLNDSYDRVSRFTPILVQ